MLVDYILNLFRQYPPNQVVTKEYYRMKSDMDLRLIEDMTKTELDRLGKLHGVRLDKRRKKDVLVAKLKEAGIYRG
jgi:hypothetical protein